MTFRKSENLHGRLRVFHHGNGLYSIIYSVNACLSRSDGPILTVCTISFLTRSAKLNESIKLKSLNRIINSD